MTMVQLASTKSHDYGAIG